MSGTSITVGVDVVVFRKGDTVAIIQYGDLSNPNVSTLRPIVQQAVAKMS